jgi:ribulose-5-phosphate 4-epimerase/fuculose-1-phosphate aldolase
VPLPRLALSATMPSNSESEPVEKARGRWGCSFMLENDLTQARVDLAAVLRWSARLGYQTGTCNHFSVMAPGRDDLFLVNPEGYFWSELTASSLILCTLDGKVVDGTGTVERTAFSLHAPIHRHNPSARACLHTHMPHATTLCLLKGGRLLPVVQEAMMFHDRIAYDEDYSGLAVDQTEGERVAGALGNKDVLFMRNHGPIVVGADIGRAFFSLYYLEQACRLQLLAMQSGQPLEAAPERMARPVMEAIRSDANHGDTFLTAIKRVLDKEEPKYRS